MKNALLAITAVFAFSSWPTLADQPCKSGPIEKLAERMSQAFVAKQLGALDKDKPYLSSIQFVVEHSLAEGYEVEEAATLAAMERWLRLQESEGVPAREARPLSWCKKGLCVFDLSTGISHNHRYIQKLTYGRAKDCAYIKTVFLLDGD